MPATQTLQSSGDGMIGATRPTVYIWGEAQPRVAVTAIERSLGAKPSTAQIRFVQSGDAWDAAGFAGPVTLNAYIRTVRPGSRVRIMDGEECLFLGWIWQRQDRGADDTVVWGCVDDRILLSYLPVRGALVNDGGTVKRARAWRAAMNPGGRWNCIGASYGGETRPVFATHAEMGLAYESPDEAFAGELTTDDITAWTPRRALRYLQTLATMPDTEPGCDDGATPSTWRTLSSDYLDWPAAAVDGMVGVDVAAQYDPLDRKLAAMDLSGKSVLAGIDQVLQAAATHVMTLEHHYEPGETEEAPGAWTSRVAFRPVTYSAEAADRPERIIPLQRGGDAGHLPDAYTAVDFDLSEDPTETREAVVVDGAPVVVEASLEYAPDGTGAIRAGWSAEEEAAFLYSVNGGPDGTPGTYAQIPGDQMGPGDGAPASWEDADGVSGRPYAEARTPEAVALARQIWPHVFVAFYIDSGEVATASAGVDGVYADTGAYPVVESAKRIPESEQRQYQVASAGDNTYERTRVRLPVRVEVQDVDADTAWHDAGYQTISPRADGVFFLSGLAEEVDGRHACVYAGRLAGAAASDGNVDPHDVEMRRLRLNLAFALDHRVSAAAAASEAESAFAPEFREAQGGLPLQYIDSPDAYEEVHQIGSRPSALGAFAAGSSTAAAPLTRYLPPGSEIRHAGYAADRALAARRYVRRRSSWTLIGIRPEWWPGDWVDRVEVIAAENDYDLDYDINAPVETVTFDFDAQTTEVGGLVSLISSSRQANIEGERKTTEALELEAGIQSMLRAASDATGIDVATLAAGLNTAFDAATLGLGSGEMLDPARMAGPDIRADPGQGGLAFARPQSPVDELLGMRP